MKKIYDTIIRMMDRWVPIILICLSLYIYKELMEENKVIRQKIEALTTLVSYKSKEILDQDSLNK